MSIDEIKELKCNRLKPEERFIIDIFDGLLVEESLKYKGHFLYLKDNYCYFYYMKETEWFDYDYDKIYTFLNNIFSDNFEQTQNFIRVMVEKHLNLMYIRSMSNSILKPLVKQHFGLKQ